MATKSTKTVEAVASKKKIDASPSKKKLDAAVSKKKLDTVASKKKLPTVSEDDEAESVGSDASDWDARRDKYALIEERDDSKMTLWDMLVEEDIRPSDVIAMKKVVTDAGKWKWDTTDFARRMRDMIDPELAAAPPLHPPPKKYHYLEVPPSAESLEKAVASGIPKNAAEAAALRAKRKAQALLSPTQLPYSLGLTTTSPAKDSDEDIDEAEQLRCQWKDRDFEGNVYRCMNTSYINPFTRKRLPMCAYHCKTCVATHTDGKGILLYPNHAGLCTTHYKSQYSKEPVAFLDMMHVPGVKLLRSARTRHPLAPKTSPVKKTAATTAAVGDAVPGSPAAKAMLGLKRGVTAAKHEAQAADSPSRAEWYVKTMYDFPLTRERYYKVATKIQSIVRMFIVKRAVQRLRDASLRTRRRRAAVAIQRFLRMLVHRNKFKKRYVAAHTAATNIQRAFRAYLYKCAVKEQRVRADAAIKMQRWYRRKRITRNLHLLVDISYATSISKIQAHARTVIAKMVRNYRIRHQIRAIVMRAQELMSYLRAFQKAARRWLAHQKYLRSLAPIAKTDAADVIDKITLIRMNAPVFKIHRWWRRMRVIKEARYDRKVIIRAIINIQRVVRGFLTRQVVRNMLYQKHAARNFLAPGMTKLQVDRILQADEIPQDNLTVPSSPGAASVASPSISDGFSFTSGNSSRRLLPSKKEPPKTAAKWFKPRVPVLIGQVVAEDPHLRDNDPDFIKIRKHVDRIESAFRREDTAGHGLLTRAAFARVLNRSGLKCSASLMTRMQNMFLGPGDCVCYENYIALARQLRYLCPLHRSLVCPVCLYVGPCEVCRCKQFVLDQALSGTLEHRTAKLCECGHHQARHVPAIRIHSETPIPAPDPIVLRLTLPRVSSIAREKCGGLTGAKAYDEDVSVQAFRQTLATDQAPVVEELASKLSLSSIGIRALEAAAKQKQERDAMESAISKQYVTAEQLRKAAIAARERRVQEQLSRKFGALDELAGELSIMETSMAEESIPPPTREEMRLYGSEAELHEHLGSGIAFTHENLPIEPVPETEFLMDGETGGDNKSDDLHSAEDRQLETAGSILLRPASHTFGNADIVHRLRCIQADVHESDAAKDLATEMLTYLDLLKRCTFPHKTKGDIIGDEHAMTDFIYHNYKFLSKYWEELTADVTHGKLRGGPPALTEHERLMMSRTMVPDPGRGNFLYQAFKAYMNLAQAKKKDSSPQAPHLDIVSAPKRYGAAATVHPKPKAPSRPIGKQRPSPYVDSFGLRKAQATVKHQAPAMTETFSTKDTFLPNIAEKPQFSKTHNHLKPRSMFALSSAFQEAPPPFQPPTTADGTSAPGHNTQTAAGVLYLPGARERFGCPYPSCGAKFTTEQRALDHYRLHPTETSIVKSTSESDAYLLRMWDSVGLNTLLKH